MLHPLLLSEMTGYGSAEDLRTLLWLVIGIPMGLGLCFYLLVRHVNRQADRKPEVEQSAAASAPIGLWMLLTVALVGFLALVKWYSGVN